MSKCDSRRPRKRFSRSDWLRLEPVSELIASAPRLLMNFMASSPVAAASAGSRAKRRAAALAARKMRRFMGSVGLHQCGVLVRFNRRFAPEGFGHRGLPLTPLWPDHDPVVMRMGHLAWPKLIGCNGTMACDPRGAASVVTDSGFQPSVTLGYNLAFAVPDNIYRHAVQNGMGVPSVVAALYVDSYVGVARALDCLGGVCCRGAIDHVAWGTDCRRAAHYRGY